MSKNTKPDVKPLNTARNEAAAHLHRAPVQGGAPGPIRTPEHDDFLARTVPCRQKPARAFLDGKSPGIQQRYAPDAKASDVEGWVEDEETVDRLVEWRQEAPYG